LPDSDHIKAVTFTIRALADLGHAICASPNAWSSSILLDIGNPHCVTFVRERPHLPSFELIKKNDEILREIAFRDNRPAPLFANGINLQWVWPESRRRLSLVIYERGEGPTPASGSSACAAACAAFRLGLTENEVEVVMPGGTLAVTLEGTAPDIHGVTLRGNAHRILDGMVCVGR
jgi:diaminopimelate epimerase